MSRQPLLSRRALVLCATALALLALGLLVYLTSRDPARSALPVPLTWLAGRHWFGSAADWLPSLTHTAAFALLTAAALPARGAWPYLGCVAWAAIEIAGEIGQLPGPDRVAADWVLEHTGAVPGAQALAQYFLGGTFDSSDVAAALAGAVLAAVTIRAWTRWAHKENADGQDP